MKFFDKIKNIFQIIQTLNIMGLKYFTFYFIKENTKYLNITYSLGIYCGIQIKLDQI